MKQRRSLPVWVAAAALTFTFTLTFTLTRPAVVRAAEAEEEQAGEEGLLPFSVRGDLATGVQWLSGDRASSVFNEYRALPNDMFLRSFSLTGESMDLRRFFEIRGVNLRQRDQFVELRLGQYGGQQLKLTLDRSPHVFSNTGRLAFQQASTGNLTLPTEVKSQLKTIATTDTDPSTPGTQIDQAAFGALITEGLASPVNLDIRRQKTAVAWLGRFSSDLTASVSYAHENRRGARPIGSTLTAFSNQNELPEPVSYATNDIKASVEYAMPRGVLCLDASHSGFNNDIKALAWDNPIQPVDSATIPGRGRMALPPRNAASQLSLSGAMQVVKGATLSGLLSRGTWTQNDVFLPFTINTALTEPALPATSLDGKIRTSLTDLSLNVAALPRLSVRGFYRRYENNNKTPQLHFDAYVRTDASVSQGPFETEPVGYAQGNQGLEAAFSAAKGLSLKLTADRETWSRQHRDVGKTRENRLGLSADYRLSSWLMLRGSLRQSERRVRGEYVPTAEAQSPLLRKFDMADRNRGESSLILQVTPPEGRWDGTITYTRARSDYPRSALGLTNDRNSGITLDLAYALSDKTSLYAGYAGERIGAAMNSRLRPVTAGQTVDDPANDWSSALTDRIYTYWFGLASEVVPDKLDLDLGLSLSLGAGRILSTGAPGGAEAGEPPDLPNTGYRWFEPRAEVRYHVGPRLTAALAYRMERYRETDFAQDSMQPYMAGTDALTSTWLGARQPGYTGHIFTIEVRRGF